MSDGADLLPPSYVLWLSVLELSVFSIPCFWTV